MRFPGYKKKGGYTLIEIIIAITILTMISSISLNAYKSTKKLNDSLIVSEEQNRLMVFMLNCKEYCATNNKVGVIMLDILNNKLFLQVDLKRVMEFKLQEGLKFFGGLKDSSRAAYVGINGNLIFYGALQIEDTSGVKHNVNFNVSLGVMNAV